MIRVLSLDGGGIRGIIPALVLQAIEDKTGERICELFDLIAGTSTGGLIALGLVLPDEDGQTPRFRPQGLAELYENERDEIFQPFRGDQDGDAAIEQLPAEVEESFDLETYESLAVQLLQEFIQHCQDYDTSLLSNIFWKKYSEKGLESLLEERFGYQPLGSALTRTLISTYDIQNRTPFFFKSWRAEHNTVEMRHIARATSAAPTYFAPKLVAVDDANRALVDGGVFINNPAMSAYAEAKRLARDGQLDSAGEEIIVVSVGTGSMARPVPYDENRDWGILDWMRSGDLMKVVFDGVSDAADYQLEYLLGENFYRFQVPLSKASDGLDDTSTKNVRRLKVEADKLIETCSKQLEEVTERLTTATATSV